MLNECTTGHVTASELRWVPYLGGGEDVVCHECFDEKLSNTKKVKWEDLAVYAAKVPAYAVPVEWVIRGTLFVEAGDVDEAVMKVDSHLRIYPDPNAGATIKSTKILRKEAVTA